MIQLDDKKRVFVPPSILTTKYFDFVWMCFLAIHLENTPMLKGWNSKLATNSYYSYSFPWKNWILAATQCLPYANISSSGNATMKMSQQCIAEECDQRYISVTYDLAIAKIALCVPSEEKLEFNNLFILLGFFLIAL